MTQMLIFGCVGYAANFAFTCAFEKDKKGEPHLYLHEWIPMQINEQFFIHGLQTNIPRKREELAEPCYSTQWRTLRMIDQRRSVGATISVFPLIHKSYCFSVNPSAFFSWSHWLR